VRGFTLAGVLVLVSIVMIFVAYTVPKQWSAIMQRERELETIYVMRQYARGCFEFQRKHNIWPSSIDQLKDARLPRFLRGGPKGEIVDPLTGKVDWLVVPASAVRTTPGAASPQGGTGVANAGGGNFGVATGPATPSTGNPNTTGGAATGTTGTTGTTTTNGQPAATGIPIKDYAGGPFVGVRPSISGESLLEFRGAKSYELWSFTAIDLQAEIQAYYLGIQNSLQYK
jgi:type II secretory pathway pseudopilin PulG